MSSMMTRLVRRWNGGARMALLMGALVLAACSDDGTGPAGGNPDAPVAAVEVGPTTLTLGLGSSAQLTATPKAADGEALNDRAVTWSSTRADIATVSAAGVVTAVAQGNAIIRATSEGKAGQSAVTVTVIPVASVTMNPATAALVVGGTQQLGATAKDAQGQPLNGRAMTWSSSNAAVATVSATGLVTAIGAGAATVRATSEGQYAEAAIKVTSGQATVASVELDAATFSLAEAATRQLVATVKDANGEVITGLGLQWKTSDPNVATVQADGTVLGLKPGQATITVKVAGVQAQAVATITADYAWDLTYDEAGSGPQRLDISQAGAAAQAILPAGVTGSDLVASPDGSVYVFSGVAHNEAGLYLIDSDGSNLRRLTITPLDLPDLEPAWSPDGLWVSFTRWSAGSGNDIWIIAASGGMLPINLTADRGGYQQTAATWSSEAIGRLAYVDQGNNEYRIWTMNADGSDKRVITSGGDRTPSWSPDGNTIAFQKSGAATFGDIWLVDATGGNERALLPAPLPGPQSAPAWSPDGGLVAFASGHETYGSGNVIEQVYTVRANGSGLVRRTDAAASVANPGWVVR